MKRAYVSLLLPACAACLLAAGCLLAPREAAPTPTPLPTPTPTPRPVVALAGGKGDAYFTDMARSVAESAACEFRQLDADALSGFSPAGRAALVLYLEDGAADETALSELLSRGVAVYVYAAAGQDVPEGLPHLRYEREKAPAMALSEALSYDNHDTPVRLLALLAAEASAADAAYMEAVQAGRVLDKGRYYEDGAKKSAAEWLSGRLDALYAGMLDGIFCENAALSQDAATVLMNQARTDIEIFSAGADGALLALMRRRPALLPRAVGADPAEAGRLSVEQALVLLYGGTAEALAIAPRVFAANAP